MSRTAKKPRKKTGQADGTFQRRAPILTLGQHQNMSPRGIPDAPTWCRDRLCAAASETAGESFVVEVDEEAGEASLDVDADDADWCDDTVSGRTQGVDQTRLQFGPASRSANTPPNPHRSNFFRRRKASRRLLGVKRAAFTTTWLQRPAPQQPPSAQIAEHESVRVRHGRLQYQDCAEAFEGQVPRNLSMMLAKGQGNTDAQKKREAEEKALATRCMRRKCGHLLFAGPRNISESGGASASTIPRRGQYPQIETLCGETWRCTHMS